MNSSSATPAELPYERVNSGAVWHDGYQMRTHVQSFPQKTVEETFLEVRGLLVSTFAEEQRLNLESIDCANDSVVSVLPDGGSIKIVDVRDRWRWGAQIEERIAGEEMPSQLELTVFKQDGSLQLCMIMRHLTVPRRNQSLIIDRFPKIFRRVVSLIELRDTLVIRPVAWAIPSLEQVKCFAAFVDSPERELGICLLTARDEGSYILDPESAAQDLLGFMHLVCVPRHLLDAFNALKLTNEPVAPGRALVFHPARTLRNGTRYEVNDLEDEMTRFAPSALSALNLHQLLPSYQREAVSHLRIEWAQMFLDRKWIRPLSSIERALWMYKQERAPDQSARVKLLEQELETLRATLETSKHEASGWCERVSQLEKEYDSLRDESLTMEAELDHLRAENARLSRLLWQTRPEAAIVAIPIPQDYEPMPIWCAHHLQGKLVLHPRAEQSLKKAQYRDPTLVYKALLVLGNEYRDMRLSTQDDAKAKRQAFAAKLGELHLGYTATDTASHRFNDYEIEYPTNSGRRHLLESHLKRGRSFDPTHCLRVYFFWDPDERVVVVGSLPAHLQNTFT